MGENVRMGEFCDFNYVGKEILTEKVTFKQYLKSERTNCVDIWGSWILGRKNSQSQEPDTEESII